MRISDWSSDVCSSDLLDQRDVTQSLGIGLAGTSQSAPFFFLNPENGVSYPVVAQIPEHRIDSMSALSTLPVASGSDGDPQTLGGLATIKRGTTASVISKYNNQPVVDIYASTKGRDLGAVAGDVQNAVAALKKDLPKDRKSTRRNSSH